MSGLHDLPLDVYNPDFSSFGLVVVLGLVFFDSCLFLLLQSSSWGVSHLPFLVFSTAAALYII